MISNYKHYIYYVYVYIVYIYFFPHNGFALLYLGLFI